MATRSASSRLETPRKQSTRPTRRATVYALVTHTFRSLVVFDRALFAALHQPLRGIRLLTRLDHEDRKSATVTWQAPTLKELKAFLGRLKSVTSKGFIRVHFDPVPPTITNVFPFSIIRPNGGVILQGKNFGDHPGQFLLKAAGFKGGNVSLGDLQWSDTVVSGIIPNIFGVLDQPARLQIVTADGKFSNEWPVTFTAAREVRLLPGNIFKINMGGHDRYNFLELGDETKGYTARIAHVSDPTPGANLFGGGDGTDTLVCQLKNGWVYAGFEWSDDTKGINGSPFGPLPEPIGTTSVQFAVAWFHDTFSSALYGLSITALGPVGVPFQ